MSLKSTRFSKVSCSLIVVFFLFASMLTGCGSSGTTPDNNTASETAPASTADTKAAEPVEPVKLVFLTQDKPFITNELTKRFTEKYPNVSFDVIQLARDNTGVTAEQVGAKFDILMATGEQVDVYNIGSGTGGIRPKALNGTLLPMDEYIAKDGLNMDTDFVKGNAKTCTFGEEGNKKYYTLPLARTIYPVFYNKDMFDAAGLAEPSNEWTMDDLVNYAKKLTKGEGANKIFGAWIPVDWGWFVGVPAQMAGWGAVKMVDGKRVPNFDDPNLKKVIDTFYQVSITDKTNPSVTEITLNKLDMISQFVSGKTAMVIGNAWAFGDIQKAKALGTMKFKLGIAPMPRVSTDISLDVSASEVSGGYVIPKTSKNPDMAFEFIKSISIDDADVIRQIPAYTKVDSAVVMNYLASFIDENGKKYENLFTQDELKGYFDNREGMKSYYDAANPEDEYTGPLWGILHDEMGKILTKAEDVDAGIKNMMTRGQTEIAKIDAKKK